MEKMHETIENWAEKESIMVARVEGWVDGIVKNIIALNKEIIDIYKDEALQFIRDIRGF